MSVAWLLFIFLLAVRNKFRCGLSFSLLDDLEGKFQASDFTFLRKGNLPLEGPSTWNRFY